MIRAHLLPEIQPRSVGKACELKPEHQQTYKDVCAILRKRLQDAKRKVDNQIKASKNTTDMLRLTDGKSGATLGEVFGWCANIAAEFKKDILVLPKKTLTGSTRYSKLGGHISTLMCLQLRCS
jgi:hypothetical protein